MSLLTILLILFSYLVGSIPTGYWLVKAVKGIDIRQEGSGSTGATNVWRCAGKWYGILVFFIDLSKGVIPVRIAISFASYFMQDQWHLLPVIAALAALIGHSRSIFLNFQGGKSAATGLGTLFALKPTVGATTFITWLVILYIGKIVSLASIMAVAFCGVYMTLAKAPLAYVAYCILGFLYVTYRHKANIVRMFEGTEPRIGRSMTDK